MKKMQRISIGIAGFLCMIVLAACNGGGVIVGTATSPAKSSPTVTQTANASTSTPMNSSTSSNTPTPTTNPSMIQYQGDLFSIDYPATWKKSVTSFNVSFQNPNYAMDGDFLSVAVANLDSSITVKDLLTCDLSGGAGPCSAESAAHIPAPTISQATYGGVTWLVGQKDVHEQAVPPANEPQSGWQTEKAYITQLKNGQYIVVISSTFKEIFANSDSNAFQPMMQSITLK